MWLLILTAVNWSLHWCAICVQYQFSCAPKLARKCEIEHWYAYGADGRTDVRSVYGHVITKFSGMGRFTNPWCSAGARESSSIIHYWVSGWYLLFYGPKPSSQYSELVYLILLGSSIKKHWATTGFHFH